MFWAGRQKPAKWIATAAVAVFALSLWPQVFPRQAPTDMSQAPLRLLFANMLIRNEHPEKILPWIARENPDVVAMVEVSPLAREALMADLKTERPYVATRYDMVVASRYPLADMRRGAVGFSLITATVKAPAAMSLWP